MFQTEDSLGNGVCLRNEKGAHVVTREGNATAIPADKDHQFTTLSTLYHVEIAAVGILALIAGFTFFPNNLPLNFLPKLLPLFFPSHKKRERVEAERAHGVHRTTMRYGWSATAVKNVRPTAETHNSLQHPAVWNKISFFLMCVVVQRANMRNTRLRRHVCVNCESAIVLHLQFISPHRGKDCRLCRERWDTEVPLNTGFVSPVTSMGRIVLISYSEVKGHLYIIARYFARPLQDTNDSHGRGPRSRYFSRKNGLYHAGVAHLFSRSVCHLVVRCTFTFDYRGHFTSRAPQINKFTLIRALTCSHATPHVFGFEFRVRPHGNGVPTKLFTRLKTPHCSGVPNSIF